ncbi:MAG: response regulator [Spirochaetota bacterium]
MEIEVILDLHELIKESIVLLERSIDRKINIKSILNAKSQMIKGDPVLIQNVILNLGLNARDAMTAGGTLTITTSNVEVDEKFALNRSYVITPGKYIQLDVEDTGIGMNVELRSRIFEPFFTTKPEGKGTGLGMAVVYGTVKEHHGFIEVYSEPGAGTNVKIFIPVVENDKAGTISINNEPVSGKGGVLVVDDEDIVRTIAGSLLESLGYECFLAENGLRAIEIYMQEKDKIDIVLLDIIMPGISGLETSERLKEIDENVKIIFSSGFRRDETVMGLAKNSNKRFIQKPYHLVELSRIISETMNS